MTICQYKNMYCQLQNVKLKKWKQHVGIFASETTIHNSFLSSLKKNRVYVTHHLSIWTMVSTTCACTRMFRPFLCGLWNQYNKHEQLFLLLNAKWTILYGVMHEEVLTKRFGIANQMIFSVIYISIWRFFSER